MLKRVIQVFDHVTGDVVCPKYVMYYLPKVI